MLDCLNNPLKIEEELKDKAMEIDEIVLGSFG